MKPKISAASLIGLIGLVVGMVIDAVQGAVQQKEEEAFIRQEVAEQIKEYEEARKSK